MSEKSFLDGKVFLHGGDCLEILAAMPDNSVDSVVTDPPYHLTSIVKRFGKPGSAPAKEGLDGLFARSSRGFMGKEWDGGDIAFRPEFWAEVLRLLKPGGHLVAFAAAKNSHRMVCAIEDAGFEIRDGLQWMYGTGFPKNLDIAKALDKQSGVWRGRANTAMSGPNYERTDKGEPICDDARKWDGWGTSLKPAYENICLARKPLSEKTVAANVLKWGTGAINIDACRIEAEIATGWGGKAAGGNSWNNNTCGLSKQGVARPVNGRWPANILHDRSEEVLAAFLSDDTTLSPARFFFSAKADNHDRIGSTHPTVKPIDLMQWLVRLITPKGGLVLDPFAGTGTTGEAAFREGMHAVLIEREPEYQADIARRMALAIAGPDERARESIKARGTATSAGPLFDEVTE
jgi:site-specific DNA-methyltransferase (adenine-specific)